MAGYPARKGVNMSQYLANPIAGLNKMPSPSNDVAPEDDFNYNDDLARFTNADFGNAEFDPEFLNFDDNFLEQPQQVGFAPDRKKQAKKEDAAAAAKDDGKRIDFVNSTDWPFDSVDPFLPITTSPPILTHSPILDPTGLPLYPADPQTYFPHQQPPTTSISTTNPSSPNPSNPPARHAAEEDKRRRNTAASARFRVKKKQREQALEKSAKELESKTTRLEERVGQLETENEWLRAIVVERHGGERLRGWREGMGNKKGEEKV